MDSDRAGRIKVCHQLLLDLLQALEAQANFHSSDQMRYIHKNAMADVRLTQRRIGGLDTLSANRQAVLEATLVSWVLRLLHDAHILARETGIETWPDLPTLTGQATRLLQDTATREPSLLSPPGFFDVVPANAKPFPEVDGWMFHHDEMGYRVMENAVPLFILRMPNGGPWGAQIGSVTIGFHSGPKKAAEAAERGHKALFDQN